MDSDNEFPKGGEALNLEDDISEGEYDEEEEEQAQEPIPKVSNPPA